MRPASTGHLDVEDGDVRTFPRRRFDGLSGVGGHRDHGYAVLGFEQLAQGIPDVGVVVSDQHSGGELLTDHAASPPAGSPSCAGTQALTTVPPASPGSIRSHPPASSARSRMLSIPMPGGRPA